MRSASAKTTADEPVGSSRRIRLAADRSVRLTHPVAILVLVWIGLAASVGYLGRQRKFGFWGYFVASLLLSWVIGLLLVFASDRRVPPSPPPVE
jgi:hypothetical protein